MMAPTHALTGAITWWVVAPVVLPVGAVLAGTPVAMLASLGPDIDHKNSRLSKAIPPLSWLIRLVTTHRYETHSIFASFVVLALFLPLGTLTIPFAVWIGWLSHLGSDSLTVQGCALFWPLTRKKSDWGFLTTDTWQESVYNVVTCLGFGAYELTRLRNG